MTLLPSLRPLRFSARWRVDTRDGVVYFLLRTPHYLQFIGEGESMRQSVGMRISAAAVLLLLAAASPGWCQGEEDIMISDVPIFPNALIILDTSGSMAETPYRTESGDPVPVGTRPGKLDIRSIHAAVRSLTVPEVRSGSRWIAQHTILSLKK